MQHLLINLKEYFNSVETAILEALIIPNSPEIDINRKRKALLILPGGAYAYTSNREADPIAYKFLAHDISVFILKYKTENLTYPSQLLQAAAAINIIRKNANSWNIDENQIYAMGFSAGGHLCANLGTINNDQEVLEMLNLTNDDIKINGMILCYPVITLKEFTHQGSKYNLTRDDLQLTEKLSIENRINENTPKAFIWHTYDDPSVPVENALILANKLRINNIPLELHIFSNGPHGLATCDETSNHINKKDHIRQDLAMWLELCINWLKKQ